jgi:circadian clock protein KaiC
MPTERNATKLRTGIPGLDDILHGGLIPYRIYLVDGDPGAGKTTLSLHYLLEGAAHGERCLYVTLSETRNELLAGAASHGWSLDGVEVVELAHEQEFDDANQLTMYPPSEVELGATTREILRVVERVNPQRVVFDSLSELRLLAQSSLRYRRQILALKQFFVGRSCTVLLLDDRTSDGSDLQLHSLAHGVISLEQLAPLYGAERRRLRVVKFRGTDYRGGHHDFTIARGGLRVFPRLVASEHSRAFESGPLASGVAELDAMLGGGPDRGTSTLLLGPAGSGKSTVALSYAVAAAARGERAVVFAFDESEATLRTRATQLGMTLEPPGPGRVDVVQMDPAEVSPGEFAHRLRHAVEHDGARVVVLDSLSGYMNAMPEERFLTLQLHELLSYLGRQGATTLMVLAQHGLVDRPEQSALDASYLADSVMLFRFYELDGGVHKAVSVLKKRTGAHESTIRELWFGPDGIHVSGPLLQYRGVLTAAPVRAPG